jgi:hypothetical protein
MYENIWFDAAILVGAMHVIAPAVVRNGFRVPVKELPKEVAAYIGPRIPQMQNLGFELLGCYDCGMLTIIAMRNGTSPISSSAQPLISPT